MNTQCICGNVGCINCCGAFKPKKKRYWKNNKYRRQKRKMIRSVMKPIKKRGEWT